MLLNRAIAQGIADGGVSLVLRRWDVPRAKPGGTQRTVVGTIRIDSVAEHPHNYRVSEAQARAAGYPDAATAQAELERRPAAHTYLIGVSYAGLDERQALAAADTLTGADIAAIVSRLDRFDAASDSGPWTRRYLRLIADNEAVRAPNLAAGERMDVPRFKRRVRRLKELGLTISLDVGYRLAPRGRALMEAIG
ncbi:hypothetical protein [Mycobacterium decipiens]|uniref:ASCH domain-containing protein n=1 Tax=Mycobacterium decipiens TaxID=1430326 RepID=A0A1X2M0C5_9MYCO|nr:hypothetical protein [Mycobacterium decipiens]OSC43050.1 hypothetical protein B8W66_01165 [Mycobacterium decipiens]